MISNIDPIAGNKPGIAQIETEAKRYADARGDLSTVIQELTDKIEKLKREVMPQIKKLVARTAERELVLRSQIAAAPELFVKPRTVIFHGIKIGLQKGKGGIEITDPDKTIELIKKIMAHPENFIRTKESPNKENLETLPASDLKKLGCRIVDTTDEVVIKPTDSEVDKVVNALLKDAVDEN